MHPARSDDEIKLEITVNRSEVADLPRGSRIALLGERAHDQLEPIVVLPPNRCAWRGRYTEENLRQAVRHWAALHGGLAPTKRDWSPERDPGPDHRWPRAEYLEDSARKIAVKYGIRVGRDDPHRRDEEHQRRWYSGEPGYCAECFHGSGCVPPEMSPWKFVIEVLGGLQVRTGGQSQATRSRRDERRRNRRMVTGGASDVHLEPSDPSASEVIETIRSSR